MSKKTESIEIRVSPEEKARLARMSAAQGETMSGFLRRLADQGAGAGSDPETGETLMAKFAKNPIFVALPLAIAAGFALSLGSPVTASPEYRMAFAQMDVNGDGVVTEAEMLASFGELGDAAMSDEEMRAELPEACAGDWEAFKVPSAEELAAEAKAEMALLDGDGDGLVSYDDLAGFLAREQAELFLMMDSNEDGYLTADELAADVADPLLDAGDMGADISEACLEALDAEALREDAEAMGEEELSEEELAALDAEDLRLMIAALDADQDGRVSLREFLEQ